MDLHALTQCITTSPTLTVVTTILTICVITRAVTELQHRQRKRQVDVATKTPIRIPYWIPFVGSAISFARDVEGTLARDRDSSGDGIISYRLGPSHYYVVNMPSLVRQIFAQKTTVLSKEKILAWFMRVAFGADTAAPADHAAFHASHAGLNLMLKDAFVSEATGKTARAVEGMAGRLVASASASPSTSSPSFADSASSPSPSPSPLAEKLEFESEPELQPWEKAAHVTHHPDGSATADFYALIVHYVGHIVIDLLYGRALLRTYPTLQHDLWAFDDGVHHLVGSLGAFTAAGRRAKAARKALVASMGEWHAGMAALARGEDAGPKYQRQDLDDVSAVMRARVQTWEGSAASATLQATTDVSVLWGANVNSNKNVFWMLLQIYAQPTLLSDIREELAAVVKVASSSSSSEASGPAGQGPPKLEIDVDGLCKQCPLLKAAFYETMRMNMSGLGIRQVNREVVLTESAADAALFGKARPQSYRIPAGASLVLANGTMQQDGRIFAEPDKFRPERFIDEEGRVSMKNLNTFGGGLYKCKGRYFAEKEVLIFAAGLLVMWDLGPAGGGEGGVKMPEMGMAGASRSPVEDVRVRLVRRYS